MALAPFFDRIYSAVGMHLAVSRQHLSEALGTTAVGVLCGQDLSANDKIIAELTINIAARLYPTLAIRGQPYDVESLKELALAINPDIEFSAEVSASTSISIGTKSDRGAIYPSASGWVAKLSHGQPLESGTENPYSASAAAAFACSALFRRIFLRSEAEADLSLSLLDFGSSTGEDLALASESIGDVLFVGLGAVGNAAIWSFARDANTAGRLIALDHETLTLSNLQRYVLGKYSDVARPKVDIALEALQGSRIKLSGHRSTLEDFKPGPEWVQPPTTCISVDNVGGRRVAQALLPQLVINGWTGDTALGTSWHVFSRNSACLACLYHPRVQGLSAIQQAALALGLSEQRALTLWLTRAPLSDEERKAAAKNLGVRTAALSPWKKKPIGDLYTDVVCGAVPIDLGGINRVEVVPLAHQSVLAGVLMAAELLKRRQPRLADISQSEPLVSWDDVLKPPPKVWLKPRPREIGCICGDPIYQSVYLGKWRESIDAKTAGSYR
jgi:hypothetical protein